MNEVLNSTEKRTMPHRDPETLECLICRKALAAIELTAKETEDAEIVPLLKSASDDQISRTISA